MATACNSRLLIFLHESADVSEETDPSYRVQLSNVQTSNAIRSNQPRFRLHIESLYCTGASGQTVSIQAGCQQWILSRESCQLNYHQVARAVFGFCMSPNSDSVPLLTELRECHVLLTASADGRLITASS